jgi:hypothetical protein
MTDDEHKHEDQPNSEADDAPEATSDVPDGDKRDTNSVRRVTQRDRKRRIESRTLVFPPDAPLLENFDDSAAPAPKPAAPPVAPRRKSSEQRFPPTMDASERAPKPAAPAPRRQPTPAPAPKRKGFEWRNVVTALFLLATLGLVAYFIFIWQNPYSPFNPLSPPIPAPIVVSETPLPSPTFTPSATLTPRPTATFTPLPADQVLATGVPTLAGTPDLTLTLLAGTPSATPPPPPFALLRTGVVYTSSENVTGCNYTGIAGSVTDFDGAPINGLTVWITGESVDSRLVTGSDNTYGAGGFLLQAADALVAQAFAAVLLAEDGVTPLSEPYTFLTRDTCNFNVALVRFVQVRER